MDPRKAGRTLLGGAALILGSSALLALVVEGLASAASAVRETRWALAGAPESIEEERHCEYDAELGWMNVRNARFEEESVGLMGGSLDLHHEIRIELVNHREDEVHIEVGDGSLGRRIVLAHSDPRREAAQAQIHAGLGEVRGHADLRTVVWAHATPRLPGPKGQL